MMQNYTYAWAGKFIRVDLSQKKVIVENLSTEIARDFIGGRGFGIKYMLDEVDPKVDALAPENKLIFATGPLTGTGAPSGNRYTVVTKSPLTGAIANSSAAGYFPPELKYAGYDFIIFEGRSAEPVYLWIYNDSIEIRPAADIWGKMTVDTEKIIKSETDPEAKIACIGPAGENQVKFACIINDGGRAAGRSGVGAVMGSKNLKAVAIRGTNGVRVADLDQFKKDVWDSYKAYLEDPLMSQSLREYGTAAVVEISNAAGILPTRNFQTGIFEGAEKISGDMLAQKYSVRGKSGKACFSCAVGCGRITRVKDPKFQGSGEGPEYESVASLGAVTGVDNLAAICKANYLCNELGMDTISTGVSIASAMEMFEKGYISEKDIGRSLKFGDAEGMLDLVRKTGLREGFGDLIAEGSYKLAEKFGHPELSMSVKKQEFPNYEPRGVQGLALSYATVSRGACHIRAEVNNVELFGIGVLGLVKTGELIDPHITEGKAKIAKELQDFYGIIDSSGMCNFILIVIPPKNLSRLLNNATGVNLGDLKELLHKGERIFNLERLFNLRSGLSHLDDTLPKRMLEEPLPEGPAQGKVVELEKMLNEYYELRQWDDKGVPKEEKLRELNISGV